jgi:hypothetical protein
VGFADNSDASAASSYPRAPSSQGQSRPWKNLVRIDAKTIAIVLTTVVWRRTAMPFRGRSRDREEISEGKVLRAGTRHGPSHRNIAQCRKFHANGAARCSCRDLRGEVQHVYAAIVPWGASVLQKIYPNPLRVTAFSMQFLTQLSLDRNSRPVLSVYSSRRKPRRNAPRSMIVFGVVRFLRSCVAGGEWQVNEMTGKLAVTGQRA